MKTTGLFKATALLWLLVGAASCDTSSRLRYETPPEGTLRSILQLKSLCTADAVTLSEEVSVCGTVTANDHFGEFTRTLVVEDASGALQIAVDATGLNALFPFGATVTVQCNGLALGRYGGRILLGAEPDGRYGVTRIAATDIARHIRREIDGPPVYATPIDFAQIGSQHIDTYVRFDDVRFAEGGRWCDLDEQQHPLTTERQIVDAAGETFTIRTAGSCIYAKEPLPSGTGSVCGIVDYFGGRYSLRVTARQIFFPTAATLPRADL